LLSGDYEAALDAASRIRERVEGTGSRKDRLRADWVEGEARVRSGDHSGAELLDRAVTEAEDLGSAYLVAEVHLATARAVPERAARARVEVAAALRSMQAAAPDDLGPSLAGGPIARALEQLESVAPG